MHYLYSVFDACIHVVQGDDILGIVIFYLHQVSNLPVGALRNLNTDLDIYLFVSPLGDSRLYILRT